MIWSIARRTIFKLVIVFVRRTYGALIEGVKRLRWHFKFLDDNFPESDAYVFSGNTDSAIYVCICARHNMRRSYTREGGSHSVQSARDQVGTWKQGWREGRKGMKRGKGWSFISTGEVQLGLSRWRFATRPRRETDGGSTFPNPLVKTQSGILRSVTACFTILNHAGSLRESYRGTLVSPRETEGSWAGEGIQWAPMRRRGGGRAPGHEVTPSGSLKQIDSAFA